MKYISLRLLSLLSGLGIALSGAVWAAPMPSETVAEQPSLIGQKEDLKVTLEVKNASFRDFFDLLKSKVGYNFVFNSEQVRSLGTITVQAQNEPLRHLLDRILLAKGLTYSIDGKIVTIRGEEKRGMRVIFGTVTDDEGLPVKGAAVIVLPSRKAIATDVDGNYRLELSAADAVEVRCSFVGMQTVIFTVPAGTRPFRRDIKLRTSTELKEVVVTGIYNRSLGSFTGAVQTITAKDLQKVGSKNLFESLKNLDPTIYIPDNLDLGSDPNALPDISMRGTSSLPEGSTSSLKSRYRNHPNTPLFILDGFETSIETVMDMDMNRIETVTVLKDASAKALYGSKAANGVIVIETRKLVGNEQRISYNGGITLEIPDLTSYNLTNSMEKLEVERIDGMYYSSLPDIQEGLTRLYNKRLKLALEGLDTHWLSKPLRTGIGYRHNVSIEVGDARALRGVVDFSHNVVRGTMKGSERSTSTATAQLSYRSANVVFRNIITVSFNRGVNSPYGSFATYAQMNPYWQATDAHGNILRWAESGFPNPMYDATIGTHSSSEYLHISDNLYAEWQISPALRGVVRVGIDQKRNEANLFLPATHSSFAQYSITEYDKRGRYMLENGKGGHLSGDANLSYNKVLGKHALFINGGFFVSESNHAAYQHTAEGFSNTHISDITFAKRYLEGSRPMGSANVVREASVLLAASYDFANRFVIDGTLRQSASSLYGANNRWAGSWSLGTAWNLHNEAFLKGHPLLQRLKLRASIGVTGNQNFSTNAVIATYNYYSGSIYGNFTGAYLNNMANPDLKWEQKFDSNVGLDLRVGDLSLSADWYRSDTQNMLTDLTIPTSTGFPTVKDNLGLVRNSGVELKATYTAWQGKDGYLSLFGAMSHNKNYIVTLSESLREYNETTRRSTAESTTSRPVPLYQDGQSMTAIWAVPSAGIDPARGLEIYIKRDGSYTYQYDPLDLIPAGDTAPKVRGNFGFNAEYKGLGFNAILTFMYGGQMYNGTLVDKVENANISYNVDKRLAEGRWREPGQISRYKRFAANTSTRPTTRFIQDRNELAISSLSLYYDVPRKYIDRLKMRRLRLSLSMNDVAQFSTIEIERGTNYPFAYRLFFSTSATF